jgi:hypothetical protein
MAEAQDPTAYIFQGFWQNLGKVSSKSLTLTLRPTNATILTNTLALFVAMSGGQLWTIIRFTLHQIRASSRSEMFDMAHNQQQIVLRNATTDVATARLMLNLAWASRENARKVMITCVTIFILAILNATLFMAAGTFSNTLIDAGSEVLSRSPHCGLWNQTYFNIVSNGPNPTSESAFQLSVEFLAKEINDVQQSLQFARDCYMSGPSQYWDSTCGTFQAPRLNWTTASNGTCPFGDEVCSDHSQTIVLDTGMIDTHNDLGINALPGDRLGYRRVTTCTALNDTGHTTDWIRQDDGSLQAFANYGPSVLQETDFTYSYSNFADFFTDFTGVSTTPYQLNAQVAFGAGVAPDPSNAGTSSFEPITALTRTDADTTVVFLSFIGKYTGPVADPWFEANSVSHRDSPLPLVSTNFARDKPIGTLGCVEQHQLCASAGKCTPLLGLNGVQENIAAKFNLSSNQKVTLDRLTKANGISALNFIVGQLAHSSMPLLAMNLTATETTTLSLPVPDDQWQLEVGYWHSVAMAQLQRTLIEYGTGQISPNTKYIVPGTGADAVFCRNIMIRSTVYSSFNVVALAVIVGFGTIIIGLSLTIERVAAWLQQRWNRGSYGRQLWVDNDMLGFQLKRGPGPSLPSPIGSMPVGQQHIFDRGVQAGIMSPAASRYYPSGLPGGSSPTRASSKALSPADDARQFPGIQQARASPSPVRSTFTADFVFDFGPQTDQSQNTRSDGTNDAEKPLPDVPEKQRNFCIDRGTSDAWTIRPAPVQGGVKAPIGETPPAGERIIPHNQPEEQDHIVDLPASGPGRWAYYSAHKRRYGPKLTAPSPHIAMPSPAGLRRQLRGHFEDRTQGNWI